MTSRIFGFKNKYSDKFIRNLEKWLGVKFTKVEFKTIPKEEIEVKPLSPPSNELYYINFKYKDK